MKKNVSWIFAVLLVFQVLNSHAEETETEDISGVVRVIRSSPEVEIFFVDRTESVIVPAHAADGNKIIKMSNDSIKSKKSISMTIDPVSRRFISLPGSKKSKAMTVENLEAEAQIVKPSTPAKKPVFKEIPGESSQ